MRYKALSKDAAIDPEVALLQAASALDAAAEKAELLNDFEGLMLVADMWMKYSDKIHEFADKVEEAQAKAESKAKEGEIVKVESKIETGFCLPEESPITVEEEEDGRVESEE